MKLSFQLRPRPGNVKLYTLKSAKSDVKSSVVNDTPCNVDGDSEAGDKPLLNKDAPAGSEDRWTAPELICFDKGIGDVFSPRQIAELGDDNTNTIDLS